MRLEDQNSVIEGNVFVIGNLFDNPELVKNEYPCSSAMPGSPPTNRILTCNGMHSARLASTPKTSTPIKVPVPKRSGRVSQKRSPTCRRGIPLWSGGLTGLGAP